MEFFDQLLDIVLDVSFWLLAGLVLAGVVQGLVPMALVRRWLSGRGIRPLLRAALIGAPLPLCSCGVLPLAAAMRRQGASKASTSSFLVATPETGA
ncbi:MAG: permease, partial [Phycisphaeraceae bacterium]|nr:permease [Phycisphaeraceae bacterium]